METRTSLAIAALLIGAACGSSPPPPSSSPPPPPSSSPPPPPTQAAALGGQVVDGLFVPDGYASAPRSCSVDADCTCNTEPDPSSPCCQRATTLSCYRQDYWSALGLARMGACSGVTCPPPPPPALPDPCRLTGRCAAGRCTDTCGASLPPAPPS